MRSNLLCLILLAMAATQACSPKINFSTTRHIHQGADEFDLVFDDSTVVKSHACTPRPDEPA